MGSFGMAALIVDAEGRVISLNDTAATMLGAPKALLVGASISDRLTLNRATGEPVRVSELLGTIGVESGTSQLYGSLAADRGSLWVRCQLARMPEAERWSMAISNAAAERQITDDLERRAVADLEWNRARAEFLANLSHHARTPLSGIAGATALLLETGLDRNQLEYVKTARSASDALLELLTGLLDEANLDQHALKLENIDFDLHTAVEELGETSAHLAHQKGLDFLIDIDPALPRTVRGDPGRLRKVLLTLLHNAIDFTAAGSVVVRAEPVIDEGGGRALRISVLDTGVGMPEPEAQEILDVIRGQLEPPPFKRGRSLHLAGRLIHAMNGKVSLDTGLGRGTCFALTIPLVRPRGTSAPEPRPTRLDGLHVLIVDASAEWRGYLHRHLERRGAEPWEVESAARAMAALEAADRAGQPFDVVLLDAHLPGVDGFELTTQIRLSDRFRELPLVLMTRNGQVKSLANLFLGVLVKPLRNQALFSTLARAKRVVEIPTDAAAERQANSEVQVLLVEDDLTCQKIAALTLDRAGFQYTIARDGKEALDQLDRRHFDLVLMDCVLPVMDGYQATREIRRRQAAGALAKFPIVAMTAEALTGDREACLDAGMDDYLSKPVQPKALYVMINKHLHPKAPSEAAPPISVDMSQLEEAAAGDADFIKELVDLYLGDTEHHLVLLEAAHRGGMFVELKREAHVIKGASANVGAVRMREIAATIERRVAENALEALAESVEALRAEFGRVRAFFEVKLAA